MGMSADDLMKGLLPEGDTPPAGQPGAAPPPAATPPKKWAEKYETPDALEAGYKSLETKLGEQGDEIQRLKGLLLSPSVPAGSEMWAPPATSVAPVADDTGDVFISRAEAKRIASEEARSEAQ